MTFLPIVERELRVASRRRGTYWLRAGMGLVCILFGAFLHLDAYMVSPQMLGNRIFGALSWIAMLYCLFAGRRSTADSLTEEKREGTLGLLFLTDLKGYDVVLGKMAATSLNAFYGLLAVLPVLAIPLLLGGVSSGEFWRVVVVLLNTFLLSLGIGIVASAVSPDSRKALGLNLLLLLCVVGGPPAFAVFLAYILPNHPFIAPFFYSCPIFSLYLSDDMAFKGQGKFNFWSSLAVTHLLTWLFVWLASLIVPHSWQDKPSQLRAKAITDGRPDRAQAATIHRAGRRRRLLEQGAYLWLAARGRFKRAQVWIFLLLVGVWWTWAWIKTGTTFGGEALNPINLTSAIIVNSAIKIWFAIEAGRQIAEDRKSNAFELLLATPLGPKDILAGQWRALRRQFLLPVIVLLVVEVLFLVNDVNGVRRPAYNGQNEDDVSIWVWTAGILMLLLDMLALGWVSMWTSLRYRGANQATVGTLIRILVIPWLVVWVSSGIQAATSSMGGPARRQPDWPFFLGWWFFAGLAADLCFAISARHQLRTHFREWAARERGRGAAQWLRSSQPQAQVGQIT